MPTWELQTKLNRLVQTAPALDAAGHALRVGDEVRAIEGEFEEETGVVRRVFKGTLFVHSTRRAANSGMLALRSRSVLLAGQRARALDAASLVSAPGSMQAPSLARSVGRRHATADSEGIVGAAVRIRRGLNKGKVGTVTGLVGANLQVTLDGGIRRIQINRSEIVRITETSGRLEVFDRARRLPSDAAASGLAGGGVSGLGLSMVGAVTPAIGGATPGLGGATPALGSMTPAIGGATPAMGYMASATPRFGGATPIIGSQTPVYGSGAGAATPLMYGGGDTPHRGGTADVPASSAWAVQQHESQSGTDTNFSATIGGATPVDAFGFGSASGGAAGPGGSAGREAYAGASGFGGFGPASASSSAAAAPQPVQHHPQHLQMQQQQQQQQHYLAAHMVQSHHPSFPPQPAAPMHLVGGSSFWDQGVLVHIQRGPEAGRVGVVFAPPEDLGASPLTPATVRVEGRFVTLPVGDLQFLRVSAVNQKVRTSHGHVGSVVKYEPGQTDVLIHMPAFPQPVLRPISDLVRIEG